MPGGEDMRWLLVFIFILIPATVLAGENCSMLGGTCRDVCDQNEAAEPGAYMDCTDKQECCIPKKESKTSVPQNSEAAFTQRSDISLSRQFVFP